MPDLHNIQPLGNIWLLPKLKPWVIINFLPIKLCIDSPPLVNQQISKLLNKNEAIPNLNLSQK
jgi:hypothetical protein